MHPSPTKTEHSPHTNKSDRSTEPPDRNGNGHRTKWFARGAPSASGNERPARKYEKPVRWLFGRDLMRSVQGTLLYTAYGKKLDARDWMRASVFPARGKSEALKLWRELAEAREGAKLSTPETASARQTDEQFWNAKKEFWFDYVSDTGDGMTATYSIAYLSLSDLHVKTGDPHGAAAGGELSFDGDAAGRLPRGAFLFVGGDTAYHVSDYMTLANRLQRPFAWAYEDLVQHQRFSHAEPWRPLFGIPGNHDYYDQLDGFRRQFRQKVRSDPRHGPPPAGDDLGAPPLVIPGYYRAQEASYVALHLPFGWWLWGLDTEVGQIDERQKKFFQTLCKDSRRPDHAIPPDKLIVATCAPTTAFGKLADPDDYKAADAFGQLGIEQPFLPKNVGKSRRADGTFDLDESGDKWLKAGQCRLDISGDVHHYARYWGPPPAGGPSPRRDARAEVAEAHSYASVVSGIGGAFHHPSQTYVDEVREQVLYPSEKDSTDEVARRIFKFWNIWRGGSVWIAGAVIAFVLYFASSVPQSSRQFVNNLPRMGFGLAIHDPAKPTTYGLPEETGTERDPATPRYFSGPCRVPEPRDLWDAATGRRAFGAEMCRVAWPWDLWVGVLLAALAVIPLSYAIFSKKLYEGKKSSGEKSKAVEEAKAEGDTLGADARQSSLVETPEGNKIKPAQVDMEIHGEPGRKLWALVALSALMISGGLVMAYQYHARITPFGHSLFVVLSVCWAVAATALSLRYGEFLFKRSYKDYIKWYDWMLTWVLSGLSVLCVAFGLWSFGRNNIPALLVSDAVFVLVLVGASVACVALPFKVGAELLHGRSGAHRFAGKLGLGLWHALLQIAVPFILVRKGTLLILIAGLVLLFVPMWAGEYFLKKNNRAGLVLTWFAYGALMLWLPYLTGPLLAGVLPPLLVSQPFFNAEWTGWWGLVPSLLAGVVGAVMCCLWFGWYLGVCFAYNGHNNEVGGAARIEEFKQFIRFRLTENSLTGYVIAVDDPEKDGSCLRPKLVDVFHLKVKGSAPATGEKGKG